MRHRISLNRCCCKEPVVEDTRNFVGCLFCADEQLPQRMLVTITGLSEGAHVASLSLAQQNGVAAHLAAINQTHDILFSLCTHQWFPTSATNGVSAFITAGMSSVAFAVFPPAGAATGTRWRMVIPMTVAATFSNPQIRTEIHLELAAPDIGSEKDCDVDSAMNFDFKILSPHDLLDETNLQVHLNNLLG